MARQYRVVGPGWKRADGTRVERGDVIEPTSFDLKTRAYKLEPVRDLEQYATGGGWYDIPGHGKVRGRLKAARALEASGAND